MNKQDIIYKRIRERVVDGLHPTSVDSKIWDELVDYIIEVSHIEDVIEALRYISLSRMWDTDEQHDWVTNPSARYWYEKVRILQDVAEDALLDLYRKDDVEK